MTTATAVPFFTHLNPDDPLARISHAADRADYLRWHALYQSMEGDLDGEINCAAIHRATGIGRPIIEKNLQAMMTLDELPRLHTLQHALVVLDMYRLRAIDTSLQLADRGYFEHIDAELTTFLTPSRPHQQLPSAQKIRKFLSRLLTILDDTISTEDIPKPPPEQDYSMQINDDGTADLFARFDAATAVAIDRRVRALAKAEDISHAEAHTRLVNGDKGVRVVLNVYQAGDVPEAPVYVQRAGWMNSAISATLVESATTTRDMESAKNIATGSYSTPDVLEAFIEGRDGECRYPTCSVSAEFCDNDHRINHADGGGTQASNLVKLCRHHHNIKTAGRIFYIQDPMTGDLVWLLADGTYLLDSATGPLSTDAKQWLQTFAQRRENRNQRARAEAQRQQDMQSPSLVVAELLKLHRKEVLISYP